MKKFKSVPIARVLIPFYIFAIIFFISVIIMCVRTNQEGPIFVFVGFIIATIYCIITMWKRAMVTILVGEDKLIARTPFCKDIIIEYERCNIGLDYHVQNGGKIWWIYLCYGWLPPYKSKNPSNRMNSLKCKQGFVRIMYQDDVYNALLEVLPKKQKTQLTCARRLAGFEKQGRII